MSYDDDYYAVSEEHVKKMIKDRSYFYNSGLKERLVRENMRVDINIKVGVIINDFFYEISDELNEPILKSIYYGAPKLGEGPYHQN